MKQLSLRLAGALILLWATSAAAEPLRATLTVAKASYKAAEDVAFQFSLTNDGGRDTYVLAWKTPLRGVEDDIFTIERDGKPVAYVGPHFKRAQPTARDWIRVPAGATISATFDLAAAYPMTVTGDYTVAFHAPFVERRQAAEPGSRPLASREDLDSNAVELHVDGVSLEDYEAVMEAMERGLDEAATAPSLQALTPTFSGCSASRQAAIVTALNNAQNYANEASSFLANNTGSTTRYTRWFGTFSSSRFNTVRSHFTNISSAIRTKTFRFFCESCSAFAYVFPNQPYQVHVCNAFYAAPQTGQDSKGGTIIHETSHFNVVAGTDDNAYGATACRSLAQSSPTRAVDNADSHEYFCELR
jgi:peptidyl-Lys metalloendopeptidase